MSECEIKKCGKKLVIPNSSNEHMMGFQCQKYEGHDGDHVFTGTTQLSEVRKHWPQSRQFIENGTGQSNWQIHWQTK